MMIPIKIQCECGQRYAFDAESGVYLLPGAVACPVCGADGTASANGVIAQNVSAEPILAAAKGGGSRIRVATPPPIQPVASAPASPVRPQEAKSRAGQVDHTQVLHEARAKILWGDPPEEVIRFLMIKGFSHEEASGEVRVLFRERVRTVRGTGIRKILMGFFVAVGAAATFLFLFRIGFISIWLLGSIAIACVSGLWMILTGILKVLAPKSERGDASEND
jgi:hypothetical protein